MFFSKGILFVFDGGQPTQNAGLEENESPFSKAHFRVSCSFLRLKAPVSHENLTTNRLALIVFPSPMNRANWLISSICINHHISTVENLPEIKRLPFIFNYPFWGTPSCEITLFGLTRYMEHSQHSHEQSDRTTQKAHKALIIFSSG